MKDRKRQLFRYSFSDQTVIQNHFYKMAIEGWLIEKIPPTSNSFAELTQKSYT